MRTVCLLSGGIDSTTLAYKLVSEGHEVLPLAIIYGQRHKKEIEAAQAIAESLGLICTVADISSASNLLSGSALTSDIDVPEGYYTDENMSITVVPGRNLILLALAGAYAVSKGATHVAYAAHGGDHAIYADCRPEFSRDAGKALSHYGITLLSEFTSISKADIVAIGLKLKIPYRFSWSCYQGRERPCLKCATCVERTEAFLLNESKDPALTEEEWGESVKALEHARR